MKGMLQSKSSGKQRDKTVLLLKLLQALQDERYEDCPSLIMEARQKGIQPYEIQLILEEFGSAPALRVQVAAHPVATEDDFDSDL